MIINTGCRTDIPAFYSKWFINRINAGYVLVRNPYYPSQVTKYMLTPSKVDLLAFCTKNPEPMFKYLDKLTNFNQYWFITITPYGKDIEPYVPDKDIVIESFKKLSKYLGIQHVSLRYDPIFFNDEFDIEKHIECFNYITSKLKGYTYDCTISFLDEYEKVKKNAPDLKFPNKDEKIKLAACFSEIANKNNMVIHSCCENDYLAKYGVDITGCMSKEIVERAMDEKLNPPSTKNIRKKCNCLIGNDIGVYNTCKHMCRYCYANYNKEAVFENVKKYDENSPLLIGNIEDDDIIKEAKQKSWKLKESVQMSFWSGLE